VALSTANARLGILAGDAQGQFYEDVQQTHADLLTPDSRGAAGGC